MKDDARIWCFLAALLIAGFAAGYFVGCDTEPEIVTEYVEWVRVADYASVQTYAVAGSGQGQGVEELLHIYVVSADFGFFDVESAEDFMAKIKGGQDENK